MDGRDWAIVAVVMVIDAGCLFGLIHSLSVDAEMKLRMAETCAPYQALHQFQDRGHNLVVCRLPQGLVVREVGR